MSSIEPGPDRLIFIVGHRRSGTTLLEHILRRCCDLTGDGAEVQPLTHLLDALRWSEDNFARMTAAFFRGREDFEDYRALVCHEFVRRAWLRAGRPRCMVFKNPELTQHLETLTALWPTASLVAALRDPRDQISSELDVSERRRALGAASESASLAPLAAAYLRTADAVLQFESRHPDRLIRVRYEDLVRWDRGLIDRLGTALGLDLAAYAPQQPWHVSDAHLETLARRPSFSPLYGQPVRDDRIGRHHARLTPAQRAQIERDCATAMAAFGYVAEDPPRAPSAHPPRVPLRFMALVEAGELERQTLWLCSSIRRHAGRHREVPITVISPRPSRRPAPETVAALARLGVEYLAWDITSPAPDYGPSLRVLVSARFEAQAECETLVALDSDTLFLAEPDLDLHGCDAALRPVDVTGMCSTGRDDPRDGYWRALGACVGVDPAVLPFVQTTVDRVAVRASYNGGFIVVRCDAGILQRTADYWLRSQAAGLRPWADRGLELLAGTGRVSVAGTEYWGSSQACLSLALWGSGCSVRTLPDTLNFPLHLYDRLSTPWPSQREIVHVHYHHLFHPGQTRNALLEAQPGFLPRAVQWVSALAAGADPVALATEEPAPAVRRGWMHSARRWLRRVPQ